MISLKILLIKILNAIASKQNTITGGASTIADSNLTASRALVSNSSGKVAVSAVTSTELDYLDGVTSNIQTQINGLKNSFTNHDGSNKTLASATWTAVANVSLSAGTYLLIGVARFDINANGLRLIRFSETENSNNGSRYATSTSTRAVSGSYTFVKDVMQYKVDSTTTVYLNAYQDSGSNLAVANTGIGVIKLV